jgi:hypothetical protein
VLPNVQLETIFVVEAAEHWGLCHAIAGWHSMSVATHRHRRQARFRQSGAQRSVRPAPIVVSGEFRNDALYVSRIQRD